MHKNGGEQKSSSTLIIAKDLENRSNTHRSNRENLLGVYAQLFCLCNSAQCWGKQVAKVLKHSLVPLNFEEPATSFWNLHSYRYQEWRSQKETRQPTDPSFSSDQGGRRAESMPTLQSGLKMQRNTPNTCTEQKSHQQWSTILNDFSSKWLARPKEEQMELVTKYNGSSKAPKLPTATEPSLPPHSDN